MREPILRRGPLFILVYHFAGYTRLVGPAAAGVFHFPFRRWAPADHTGASLWVSSYVGLGYLLGSLGFTLNSSDQGLGFCVFLFYFSKGGNPKQRGRGRGGGGGAGARPWYQLTL